MTNKNIHNLIKKNAISLNAFPQKLFPCHLPMMNSHRNFLPAAFDFSKNLSEFVKIDMLKSQ